MKHLKKKSSIIALTIICCLLLSMTAAFYMCKSQERCPAYHKCDKQTHYTKK